MYTEGEWEMDMNRVLELDAGNSSSSVHIPGSQCHIPQLLEDLKFELQL